MDNEIEKRRAVLRNSLGLGLVGAFAAAGVKAGTTTNPNDYLSDGTGAVSRTLGSKLNDFVSVKDFGATGLYSVNADDTQAIQNALNYAGSTVNDADGGIVYVPKGDYTITNTLTIPNKVKLVGEGSTSVIRAHQAFSRDYMVTLGPLNSNVFDTKICGLRFSQQNGLVVAEVNKSIIYSNSINQQCGVFDVTIDGLNNVEGIVFEASSNPSSTYGPAMAELNMINILTPYNAVNAIRSNIGGMILKISHVTIEGGTGNRITRGVYMEQDILCGDTLHFENCDVGIEFGTNSLGGRGSVITGHSSTKILVGISSGFHRGGVALDCLDNRSSAQPAPITVLNAKNGNVIVNQFVTSYIFQA